MRIINGKTFGDVYKKALIELVENPEYISAPRGYKINEIIDATLVIENPKMNLFKNSFRNIPLKYLKRELALYFSARRDAEGFSNASKFWDNIKTENNTINSAYGYLIFKAPIKDGRSQFQWAIDSIKKDKDSRQAVMFFNRPEFQYEGNKDFVCTFNMAFHIRNNKLSAITSMRSQDIRRGTQYDIPFFTLVQYIAYLELKKVYPELELGTYTHKCYSLHIYQNLMANENDVELAKNMINGEWEDCSVVFPETSNIIMTNEINEISNVNNMLNKIFIGENKDFYNWLTIEK